MSDETIRGEKAAWVCPQCGTRSSGDVCAACGSPRKKKGALKWVALVLVLALLAGAAVAAYVLLPPYLRYQDALELAQAGDYDQAYLAFLDMGDYRDSPDQARQALEQWREAMLEQGLYAQALEWLAQNAPGEEAALAPEFHYLYGVELYHSDAPDYAAAYEQLLAAGDYADAQDLAAQLPIDWGLSILAAPDILRLNSFLRTVELDEAQSAALYEPLLEPLYERVVENGDATFVYIEQELAVRQRLLEALSGSLPHREELAVLFSQLDIQWPQDFVREHPDILEALWEYPVATDIVSHDDCIYVWMMGTWRTENRRHSLRFYIRESDPDTTMCQYALPWVSEPAGTKYWDIRDSIFMWVDKDLNELAKVYRFTLTGPDTVEVYCYKDEKTYTLQRVQ